MTEKQRLLLAIEEELEDMTEEQKQELLSFLWKRPSMICQEAKQAV